MINAKDIFRKELPYKWKNCYIFITYFFTIDQVYTINQESKYLMVTGVPSVGATKELLEQFALYGDIEE